MKEHNVSMTYEQRRAAVLDDFGGIYEGMTDEAYEDAMRIMFEFIDSDLDGYLNLDEWC